MLDTGLRQSNNLDNSYLWKRIASRLQEEFGEEVYGKWLSKLDLYSIDCEEVIMSAPSKFIRDWIKREYLEKNTGKSIKKIWLEELPKLKCLSIIYIEKNSEKNSSENFKNGDLKTGTVISISKHDNVFAIGTELNPRFTFENFVVGKCNKLASSAAKMIAGVGNLPSIDGINPLFMYGGVGLGKTHLSQAIAWHIKENNKKTKVVYLSAEKFMYQFVQSLRNKDIMEFKERFRGIDVLIIDDLQFIAGKDGTQEELLYTLSSLIESNKQVVLACDKSPGDLNDIGEKLKSRISGGMIVDFKCPNYETRLEILKSKIKNVDINIKEDVLELMASRINSNIRDLEGALKKLVANHMFTGEEINLENTKSLLEDLFRTNHNSINIEKIQKTVAEFFSIKVSELNSNSRSRNFVRPRQLAMYLSRNLTSKNLPEIGREFGGKNHATVIHAIKKIGELTTVDQELNNQIKLIENKLKSSA